MKIPWYYFFLIPTILAMIMFVITGSPWVIWLLIVGCGMYALSMMVKSLTDARHAMDEGFREMGEAGLPAAQAAPQVRP